MLRLTLTRRRIIHLLSRRAIHLKININKWQVPLLGGGAKERAMEGVGLCAMLRNACLKYLYLRDGSKGIDRFAS